MKPVLTHLFTPTPLWLDAFFIVTTLLTLGLLYRAARRVSTAGAVSVLAVSLVWLSVLAMLAHQHFFQQLDATPPHFLLVMGVPILIIIGLHCTVQGRVWSGHLSLSDLTILNTVRVPVELVLYSLYVYQQVPQLMTFEGGNYDILAGLTAPIVAFYSFRQKSLAPKWLLVWNLIALGSLVNIVVHAALSAPLPFQQMAFEQPNVALLKAPYIWLPGFIVPVVLFGHIISIRRLVQSAFRSSSTPIVSI